jgi:hypothetical protein
MGYYFTILSFPYLVSAIVSPIIFKNVPRKLQFVISMIVSSSSFILMGPSNLFGVPEKLYFVLIGMFINGFIVALIFVNAIPEVIECFQVKYKVIEGYDKEFDDVMNDQISGLY